MNWSAFPLILLFVLSCSNGTSRKQQAPREPIVSEQAYREFTKIESSESQNLNRYRQMRANDWNQYLKPQKPTLKINRYQPRLKASPRPKLAKPLSEEKKREISMQIDQNLSFHCAKRRKRYASEKDCRNKVQVIHQKCIKQHPTLGRSRLSCVKRKL